MNPYRSQRIYSHSEIYEARSGPDKFSRESPGCGGLPVENGLAGALPRIKDNFHLAIRSPPRHHSHPGWLGIGNIEHDGVRQRILRSRDVKDRFQLFVCYDDVRPEELSELQAAMP
ncbi:hypothetical protein [Paraburkholderia sp. BL25I1N1]|uniref:hypothetical protein n=1 Tax=Paraburkholderia sp. BL25I1N1 TaxID=1938804 RepID=UPI0011B25DAC|nr:hypothetical protein [Paraburkholderia sp. BL25I1N1]